MEVEEYDLACLILAQVILSKVYFESRISELASWTDNFIIYAYLACKNSMNIFAFQSVFNVMLRL